MQGQKEAVVEAVKIKLGSAFIPYMHNALSMLSAQQLEEIKADIGTRIVAGLIEYGKDKTKVGEAMAYARSMVMNHLKKAKELNGGQAYQPSNGSGSPKTLAVGTNVVAAKTFKGINLSLLPEELKQLVTTL